MFKNFSVIFLIFVIATFSLSLQTAEAGFWDWIITGIVALVSTALVILSGGAALAFFAVCPVCGAFSLGGLSAAVLTAGAACGTGLICGGSDGDLNRPAVVVTAPPGTCNSEAALNFYNINPVAGDQDASVAIYRFSRSSVVDQYGFYPILQPQYLNFFLARWMGGGPSSDVSFAGSPWKTLAYKDFCDSAGRCQMVDQTTVPNSYLIYAAQILRPTGPILLSAQAGSAAILPIYSESKYQDCKDDYGREQCRINGLGLFYTPGTAIIGPYKIDAINPALCIFGSIPTVSLKDRGCDFIELQISATGAEKYDIVCDGAIIQPDVDAAVTSYKDDKISPDKSRIYSIVAKKGSQSASSDPLSASPYCPSGWCAIDASPATIKKGESSTLSWRCSSRLRSCDLNGSRVSSSGSRIVSPETTTEYALSCSGGGGGGGQKVGDAARVQVGKSKIIEVRP